MEEVEEEVKEEVEEGVEVGEGVGKGWKEMNGSREKSTTACPIYAITC